MEDQCYQGPSEPRPGRLKYRPTAKHEHPAVLYPDSGHDARLRLAGAEAYEFSCRVLRPPTRTVPTAD
jgi:hypothetical protein